MSNKKHSQLIIYTAILMCFSIALASTFQKEICNLGWEHIKHEHSEAAYQYLWCKAHNGITEYENGDKTRVDCLTSTHAVEFDFANKWAESIGQALHYGKMTKKRPKVVLILESPKQFCYFERVKSLAELYNFDAEYITNEILSLNKYGKCKYTACKCHRKSN